LRQLPTLSPAHGKRISVAFTIVPFVDDKGALTGIAAIKRDVTARFEETRALRNEINALREHGRTPSIS
jgi:hypothetical protein